MKRLLPIALVLIVALATLVFWIARGDGEVSDVAGPGEHASSPSQTVPEAALAKLAEPSSADEGALAGADPAAGEQERREARLRDYDPALALRIAGVVQIPAGTPADEELWVEALETERDPTRGGIPALRPADAGVDDDLLATAQVDATGAFVVELPPDADVVWLVLHSRYLRVRDGLRVPAGGTSETLVFEPELGGWISCRLVLPAGGDPAQLDRAESRVELQPDPMAMIGAGGVSARARPRERERRGRLDEDLGFEWTAVSSGVPVDVRVRTETFAAVKTAAFELKPGEHREFELALSHGGSIRGTVRDDNGRPLAGAELEVEIDPLMMGLGGYVVRRGESEADGSFSLDAVTPGELIVRAQAEGYLDARSELELAEGATESGLEVTLERGSAVAGLLLWPDGSPVPDVQVRAEFDMANLGGMGAFNAMRGPRGEGRTDENGAFRITGLGKGPFTVRASAERESEDWTVRRDAVAPDTEDLELVLSAPLALSGRVVDEAGEPVPAFRVRARTRTQGMIPGLGAETVARSFEDDQGLFRLSGLHEGEWVLAASGQGFGRGEELELELPLVEGAPEPVLRLPHAAVVLGTVLSPEGAPVAGATVQQEETLQGLVARAGQGDDPPSATSAADGTFSLEELTPGSISLAARRPGFAKSLAVPVDLIPAGTVEGVVLTLRRGGRILGEVYGSDGALLAGATVIAQQPTDLTSQSFANTDAEGQFQFEGVSPGSWQVMTLPGGGNLEGVDGDNFAQFFSDMKLQMAEVVEGEDTWVVLGAPPADPVRVTGLVRVENEPQAGVLVSFIVDGAEGMGSFKFTSTGADGRFALDLDQPGGYLVQVQKVTGAAGQQQSVQMHVDVPQESEVEVDLELPVGMISGVVRGPDGRPLEGARVSLTTDGPIPNQTFMGGHYAEISSGAGGRYEILWLKEGRYTVAAGGAVMGGMFGDDGDAPGRLVRSGVRVREGEHVEGVDFRLREPGRLSGTIRDGAGQPVEGAAVFLRDDDGQLVERIAMIASDSSGHFTCSGVSPGRYTVSARSTEMVSPVEAQVTVREGEDTSVTLAVTQGTILRVVLSDREGNPVDCALTVLDEQGRQVNGSWSLADLMALATSGSFTSKEQRVGPLPAGRYRVEAVATDGKSASKPVNLSGQAERKLILRLKD